MRGDSVSASYYIWLMRASLLVLLATASACRSGFRLLDDARPPDAPADTLAAREHREDRLRADRVLDDGTLRPDSATPLCPGPVFSRDVDSTRQPGQHTSIAVNAQGEVHISHYSAGDPPGPLGANGYHDARYSVLRGGVWRNEEIYTAGLVGAFSAIGLGPSGEVHAIFYQDGVRRLLHSWRDASSWKAPVAIAGSGGGDPTGWGNDLAVDASGSVHVVTFTSQGDQVLYVRRVATVWEAPVPVAQGSGDKSGIAVDAQGKVHISFCSAGGQLRHVVGQGTAWGTPQILDSGIGACPSDLAIDGQGDVHIGYYDGARKALKYVGQGKGVFGAPITLDAPSGVSVGSFNAIAATSGGDLWLAYHDFTGGDLKLIRRQGGSWGAPQAIDTAGYVGRWVSAALGPAGELHIAHWNGDTTSLRYTRVCP
jgi:hypothetical protein